MYCLGMVGHKSLESPYVKVHETSQCVKSERENGDGDSDFMPSKTSKKRQRSVKVTCSYTTCIYMYVHEVP